MQEFMCTRRIIQLAFMVLFPSLLQASSLWMSNNKRRIDYDLWTDHTSNVVDDYQYVGQQILFLEKLISKVSQTADNKRVGYEDSQTAWYNEVHSNHLENKISPDYDDNEDKKFEYQKKIVQASLILGSVGWAFGKLGLISVISPRVVVQDTATSTSSASMPITSTILTTTTPRNTIINITPRKTTTPATTTKPTTATTTTKTTTIAPVTCSTTTSDATGTYKTIRTPGTQVTQCLSITVAVGSRIKITCRVVYTQSGTYTAFYDNSGTAIVTTSPVVNQVYTTTDNTLIIESLADSSASSPLRCKWTTIQ
ncbi:cell wall protein DAN4-like [Daphnia pulex]|uniref:cell wall protein DAN4-like n=1 Tax=Daphnia pulex TaxID=6669 RepID=UPI001EE1116E|nr:cell wall protein DAN4-like [Daphnia pulex]XP_046460912.1 cell wall protein DAN4-like [Daphnia pulex]